MGSSSSKDRQLSCQGEPRPPVSHHDRHVPQASDPNHLTQLDGEFQNKLDLKDGDETEDKGSNFEFGGEQLCDEAAAPEPGKSQGVGDDDHDHHDHEHDDEDDGWNVGDEGCNWIENVNDGVSGDVDEVDVGEVENKDERSSGRAHQYKLRPEAEDCSFYLNTGTCKFGFNCRFNHPVRRKNQAVKEKVGRRDELEERSGQTESKAVKEKVGRRDELEERSGQTECKAVKEKVGRRDELEERSGQTKCKAVKEKVGRRDELEEGSGQTESKAVKEKVGRRDELEERSGQTKCKAVKEKVGRRDELEERSGQTECKFYSRSGGCKFGKACKFNHTRGKHSAAPVLELNFLGLPVRLGKKECPYYMRTGSCKFGENCKYNHPDPTTVGGCDPASGYGNGSSISLQGVSQPSIPSWSSTSTLNETTPFVPIILSPTPEVSPRSSDWNGYQAPVYLSERSMHPPSTYAENNPAIETNSYMHHRKPMPVEEFPERPMPVEKFPERPGEPECSYLKTGDCKFKSNHKFRHRKNRITRLPPCNLSDKGLLLRPDQNVCTQYNRFGICKFGAACRFDHPIDPPPSTMPGLDQQSSYTNSASVEMAGNGGASDATIQ